MKKYNLQKLIIAGAVILTAAPTAMAGSQHAPQYQPQPDFHQTAYEDEVIVYEERARRKQSYYFSPRDARSFKCRTKRGTQKCSFDFRGDNADDVEYYLAQALIFATGNTQNQAYCSHTRRAESVTCSVRGDLTGMDTGKLRYALYGR